MATYVSCYEVLADRRRWLWWPWSTSPPGAASYSPWSSEWSFYLETEKHTRKPTKVKHGQLKHFISVKIPIFSKIIFIHFHPIVQLMDF